MFRYELKLVTLTNNVYDYLGKPEISLPSREIKVAVDSTVHIPCVATGIPSANYKWSYNGYDLVKSKEIYSHMPQLKIHGGNITITKVTKKNKGFYQCVASNIHGEALLTIHLSVVGMTLFKLFF